MRCGSKNGWRNRVTEMDSASLQLDCGLCVVRPWRLSDKQSLLSHANNRNVWRNLAHRFPHPYTEADADSWLTKFAQQPGSLRLAIDVGGEAVGGIGAEPGEGIFEKSATFGYWLGEAFWGRGIMTAAARATSNYVLATTPLVRLEAPVFEWNPASMRVLEKCGFEREGVRRKRVFKDGKIVDEVLYARVRDSW
jgi:RimJ/RimL family protein N-acetyltransferase